MVTRYPRFIRLLAPALALCAATAAFAAEGPRRGMARPGPVTPVNSIQAPAVDAAKAAPAPSMKITVARLAPASGADKGSYYTDMGDPSVVVAPNEIEKAKLDMARAAVALARAAGTLYQPLPVEGLKLSPQQMEAMKAEAARTRVPVTLKNAPAAGVGDFPALQLIGPEGLSELEQAKLDAVRQGRPAPTPEAVVKPSRRTGSRDDGQVKTSSASTPKGGK